MKWLSVIWAFALVVPVSAQTAPFTITSSSPLPNATLQVNYSQQLTSTGGVGTVTWSLGAIFLLRAIEQQPGGGLPPGASLTVVALERARFRRSVVPGDELVRKLASPR